MAYNSKYTGEQVEGLLDKANALTEPTKVSELENDAGYITSSDVPTKVSELSNDSGYITDSALSGYAKSADVPTKVSELTNDVGYITEAAIPTKTSELENDSGFVTEEDISDVVALQQLREQYPSETLKAMADEYWIKERPSYITVSSVTIMDCDIEHENVRLRFGINNPNNDGTFAVYMGNRNYPYAYAFQTNITDSVHYFDLLVKYKSGVGFYALAEDYKLIIDDWDGPSVTALESYREKYSDTLLTSVQDIFTSIESGITLYDAKIIDVDEDLYYCRIGVECRVSGSLYGIYVTRKDVVVAVGSPLTASGRYDYSTFELLLPIGNNEIMFYSNFVLKGL